MAEQEGTTVESRVQDVIRQAINNSHDATYYFPGDVEEHVERVALLLLDICGLASEATA